MHHPRTKGMSSKDGLIVLICTNADGSLKAAMAIMGFQRTLNVFPLRRPSRTMFYRKKRGAINAPHENELSVFLPLVRASVPPSKRVVLLMGKF